MTISITDNDKDLFLIKTPGIKVGDIVTAVNGVHASAETLLRELADPQCPEASLTLISSGQVDTLLPGASADKGFQGANIGHGKAFYSEIFLIFGRPFEALTVIFTTSRRRHGIPTRRECI